MKLKYKMSVIDIDNVKMAVPLNADNDFRGVLQMNETSSRIIQLLSSDITEEEIISALADEYDAPPERIKTSVEKFISTLHHEGLLEN